MSDRDEHAVKWEPYKPGWLVELARTSHPEETRLPDALARCTSCRWRSRAYVRFVDASNPNRPGSEWQFEENIILEHPREGTLVLDILRGGRVGGVEFLARLLE